MSRLTPEREADIRRHADAHKPCDDDFHALLDELDAARAERNGLAAEIRLWAEGWRKHISPSARDALAAILTYDRTPR